MKFIFESKVQNNTFLSNVGVGHYSVVQDINFDSKRGFQILNFSEKIHFKELVSSLKENSVSPQNLANKFMKSNKIGFSMKSLELFVQFFWATAKMFLWPLQH